MVPEPGESFGRYQIIEEIGRGPLGVVFRARDRNGGNALALKLLQPDGPVTEEARTRIRAELRALASMKSSRIAMPHEIGMDQGRLFLASALRPDGSLQARLDQGGPLARPVALELCLHVAQALDAAHRVDVLHGGVRPTNVLGTRRRGAVVTQLADFGAGLRAQLWVAPDDAPGYDDYAAPELLAGGPVDARSDIYSLGCLLHAALVGRPPIAGASAMVITDDLDARVDRLLRTALQARPGDRLSDAAEMGEALQELIVPGPPAVPTPVATTPAPTYALPPSVLAATLAVDGGAGPGADIAPADRSSRRVRTRTLLAGVGVVALLIAAGSWAWGQSHGGGSSADVSKPSAALSAPEVAATAGYRSVVFKVSVPAGNGAVTQVDRGAGWQAVGSTSITVPTATGGQRACLRARISKDGEYSPVTRKCEHSQSPTVRAVRVHPDCVIDGRHTQVCYQLRARGFRPGSHPVLKFEVDDTTAGTVPIPIDKRGQGMLPDDQHFHFAARDAGKSARITLDGSSYRWTVASR